jgi:hypothetical protein
MERSSGMSLPYLSFQRNCVSSSFLDLLCHQIKHAPVALSGTLQWKHVDFVWSNMVQWVMRCQPSQLSNLKQITQLIPYSISPSVTMLVDVSDNMWLSQCPLNLQCFLMNQFMTASPCISMAREINWTLDYTSSLIFSNLMRISISFTRLFVCINQCIFLFSCFSDTTACCFGKKWN